MKKGSKDIYYEKKRYTTIEVLLLVGLCLSGAAALIYEIAWTRALSLVMGSTTYALSTMLASFMSGLTLGGYLGGLWADKTKNPAFTFGLIEGVIAIFGLATIVVIKNISPIYAWVFYTFGLSFTTFSFSQFVLSFLIMLVPTTLMGATFPMVLKARTRRLEELGRETGYVYSINNLGAIIGSFAAGFIFIPIIGVSATNLVAALLNMAVAIIIIFYLRPFGKTVIWLASAVIVLPVIFYYTPNHPFIYNYYLASRFASYDNFEKLQRQRLLLFEKEGIQGFVQVFKNPRTGTRYLVHNGKTEGSIPEGGMLREQGGNPPDWVNQVLLAYLPLTAKDNAKSFLNIGLGTGNTFMAAASMKSLTEIDCVEIDAVVLEAVKEYFYPTLFTSSRIKFIVADARNYLTLVSKKYDIISSGPSYPVDQGMSSLFSLEFFKIVKSRLTEEGIFAQWIPAYILSDDDTMIMIRTFAKVFPYIYIYHVLLTNDIILLGSSIPMSLNQQEIADKIENTEMGKGLERTYRLWMQPEDVRKAVKDGPINSDDRPILEFIAARSMLGL